MLDCMKSRGIEKTVIKISDSIWFGYRKHQNEESGFIDTSMLSMVFDGYILNKEELFNELRKYFDSSFVSSAKIIYTSYMEWGVNAFKKLNGIFAIAIWDKQKKQLILVRDRFGIKSLYYYQNSKKIIFCLGN
ncbi:MAG: Asparagine synthetase [glutamine-hydrolyzing] 2 [Candidatus Methanoperedenaceae archaeon GB50]|nr:MAG: Asparagine synthetase [glutamine-hydrolyzing] 2 [Candidatus Methanoperedenaceae archaeon GB50]